jgi:hypothetical protein
MAGSSRGDRCPVLEQLRHGGSRFHHAGTHQAGRAVRLRGLCLSDPHWEHDVLSAVSADLVVLPVRDVYWNDRGNTDRVIVPGFWRLRPVEKGRP